MATPYCQKLILGVKFTNGLEVIAKANNLQTEAAAARQISPSPTFGDSSGVAFTDICYRPAVPADAVSGPSQPPPKTHYDRLLGAGSAVKRCGRTEQSR